MTRREQADQAAGWILDHYVLVRRANGAEVETESAKENIVMVILRFMTSTGGREITEAEKLDKMFRLLPPGTQTGPNEREWGPSDSTRAVEEDSGPIRDPQCSLDPAFVINAINKGEKVTATSAQRKYDFPTSADGYGPHDFGGEEGTTDCTYHCGAWIGPHRSGGPQGMPYEHPLWSVWGPGAHCPKNPTAPAEEENRICKSEPYPESRRMKPCGNKKCEFYDVRYPQNCLSVDDNGYGTVSRCKSGYAPAVEDGK